MRDPRNPRQVINYMVDMGWVLTAFPALHSAQQLIICHGESQNTEMLHIRSATADLGGWAFKRFGVVVVVVVVVVYIRSATARHLTCNVSCSACGLQPQLCSTGWCSTGHLCQLNMGSTTPRPSCFR